MVLTLIFDGITRVFSGVLEHTNTDLCSRHVSHVDRLGRGGVDVDALAQHVMLHGEGDGGDEGRRTLGRPRRAQHRHYLSARVVINGPSEGRLAVFAL